MNVVIRTIALLFLVLNVAVMVQAQAQRNNNVFHRVQVRVYLPDGPAPSTIRVQIDSERSGQPVQFKNLFRETFTEFTLIGNGNYIVTVSADNDNDIEPYTERFTLRSNFPLLRQINVFMRRKFAVKDKGPGTIAAPGTVDASRIIEIPKAARKAFERGLEKAEKGKTDEAIKAFQEAIKHHPDYFEAINDLSVQFMKIGRYEDATAQIQNAMKLAPDSPLPHLNLGIVLIEQKHYVEACDALREAIRLDFNNPLSHYQLGLACFNMNDLMRAQVEFEITVESAAKKIPLARLYLADLYKRQSRTADAVNQLESFLRETTENPYTEAAKKELSQLKQK
jgi:Tfp pilus assembly protein PilF